MIASSCFPCAVRARKVQLHLGVAGFGPDGLAALGDGFIELAGLFQRVTEGDVGIAMIGLKTYCDPAGGDGFVVFTGSADNAPTGKAGSFGGIPAPGGPIRGIPGSATSRYPE